MWESSRNEVQSAGTSGPRTPHSGSSMSAELSVEDPPPRPQAVSVRRAAAAAAVARVARRVRFMGDPFAVTCPVEWGRR